MHFCTYLGHKGQLAPRCHALYAMNKKLYHGIQKAINPFRLNKLNTSSLGLGGGGENHNLRPVCRRHLLGHFTHPLGDLRFDAPVFIFKFAVPMMAINWD